LTAGNSERETSVPRRWIALHWQRFPALIDA
jgi:hypothetical protein